MQQFPLGPDNLDPELTNLWMVQRARDGDAEAIKALVDKFGRMLWESAGARLTNSQLLGYAVEETLLSFLRQPEAPQTLEEVNRFLLDHLVTVIDEIYQDRRIENLISSGLAPDFSESELKNLYSSVVQGLERSKKREKLLRRSREVLFASFLLIGVAVTAIFLQSRNLEQQYMQEKIVIQQTVVLTATPPPAHTRTPTPQNAITLRVKSPTTLNELSERYGIPLPILTSLNGVEADQKIEPGTVVIMGIGVVPLGLYTPTPVTPVPKLPLLTHDTPVDEIFNRVRQSRRMWHTLWVDAQIIDYGREGLITYAGPPVVSREQVWISQPYLTAAIAGKYGEKPTEFMVSTENRTYLTNVQTGDTQDFSGRTLQLRSLEMIFPIEYPSGFTGEIKTGDVIVIEQDEIANRAAIVLDIYSSETYIDGPPGTWRPYRLWIDAGTGVILRRQTYSRYDGKLLSDISFTKIVYDQDFPAHIFQPYLFEANEFVLDYLGEPEGPAPNLAPPQIDFSQVRNPRARVTPPPGFDFAHSRLEYELIKAGDLYRGPYTLALFGDGYFLGEVDTGYTDSLRCSRLADGERLVYFYPTSEWRSNFRWLNLHQMSQVFESPDVNLNIWEGTASPVEPLFVYFGCGPSICRVTLFNLDTGEFRWQIGVRNAYALAWKPDGRQIAFIGQLSDAPEDYNSNLFVVNAVSGEILYEAPIRYEPQQGEILPPDAPVLEWGINFPPTDYSENVGCANPIGVETPTP
jgi:hypothetical protein